jgi:shikimate dehydrogenase
VPVGDRADTAVPRRFAVIGSPIAHSLSPLLHRTAYAALGVHDARYDRFEVGAGGLAAFLASAEGSVLQGLSVTMPGKPEAFALATERDETATALEVANTLIRRADGCWRAENHDVYGITAAFADHGVDAARAVGVLGSGATATSALAASARLGAERVLLSARSPEKLRQVLELSARLGVSTVVVPWKDNARVLEADACVSALALDGARAVARTWQQRGVEASGTVLLDALYDPWPTPIAQVAQAAGAEVISGLEMLVHQADIQLRSMLGVQRAPVELMLDAARAAVDSQQR